MSVAFDEATTMSCAPQKLCEKKIEDFMSTVSPQINSCADVTVDNVKSLAFEKNEEYGLLRNYHRGAGESRIDNMRAKPSSPRNAYNNPYDDTDSLVFKEPLKDDHLKRNHRGGGGKFAEKNQEITEHRESNQAQTGRHYPKKEQNKNCNTEDIQFLVTKDKGKDKQLRERKESQEMKTRMTKSKKPPSKRFSRDPPASQ